jgi:hypothetical protein
MKLFERIRHFTVAVLFGAALHSVSHELSHFAHEVSVALGRRARRRSHRARLVQARGLRPGIGCPAAQRRPGLFALPAAHHSAPAKNPIVTSNESVERADAIIALGRADGVVAQPFEDGRLVFAQVALIQKAVEYPACVFVLHFLCQLF